jgi:uridine phosphorylase
MTAVGIAEEEVPDAVIVEGSWWLRDRNRVRLQQLEAVRELAFPEMYFGRFRGRPVVYSCVYGAPRAVEPVHVFGAIGSPLLFQIGSCGALDPTVRTGDIVLPDPAAIGEGASQYYQPGATTSQADVGLLEAARSAFTARGFTVHVGPHLTTSALFAQPPETVARWSAAGYLAVDMETSAVFTVARRFGLRAVSLLFAWDELLDGRTFLDPYSEEERARQDTANGAIFEVALELLEVSA